MNEDWRALFHHAETCGAIITVERSHTEVVRRILKKRYQKRQVDYTSPVPSEMEAIANKRQQRSRTISGTEVDSRQHEANIEPKQSSLKVCQASTNPSPQKDMLSKSLLCSKSPVYSHQPSRDLAADALPVLNDPLQRKHNPSHDFSVLQHKPSHHIHLRTAQILQQELLRKSEDEMHVHIGVGSPANPVHANSNINLKPAKEPTTSHGHRPTALRLSSSTAADHSDASPSSFSARLTDHVSPILSPTRQSSEKVLGRGIKRVAHKSDEEIRSQRQNIEHKLISSSSTQPQAKRPRVSSTSSSSNYKGFRAELMKKFTKK